MFLQYAPAGAVLPLFSLYLQRLGFSPFEIGLASAMQAVGTLFALLAGQAADRWLPAERCLVALAFAAGALLWVFPALTSPAAVVVVTLLFWVAMAPAITLGTTICFAQLATPERHFSGVRLWGTVGWMAATWLLGYWFTDPTWASRLLSLVRPGLAESELADAFRLASVLAFALAAYGLTLPHTPPQHHLGSPFAPLATLALFRDRSFSVFLIGSFGVSLTGAFYSQNVQLLLAQLGVADQRIGPLSTVGQLSEVSFMALLPMLLLRLEMRGTMLFGLVVWTIGLAALASGEPLGLVVVALATWGTVVACYLVIGQVFVNSRARGDIRTSAQALMTCCNAFGSVLGHLVAGWTRGRTGGDLRPVFALATALAAVATTVFLLGFRAERNK